MEIFLSAVLPVLVVGIISILVVWTVRRQGGKPSAQHTKDDADSSGKETENYMAIGISLGLCFGTVIGSIGLIPLAYGPSFGMLIGMLIGMNIPKK